MRPSSRRRHGPAAEGGEPPRARRRGAVPPGCLMCLIVPAFAKVPHEWPKGEVSRRGVHIGHIGHIRHAPRVRLWRADHWCSRARGRGFAGGPLGRGPQDLLPRLRDPCRPQEETLCARAPARRTANTRCSPVAHPSPRHGPAPPPNPLVCRALSEESSVLRVPCPLAARLRQSAWFPACAMQTQAPR